MLFIISYFAISKLQGEHYIYAIGTQSLSGRYEITTLFTTTCVNPATPHIQLHS